MTVPPIEHQTGWRRPSPVTLCQDMTVLQRIFLYDYDIQDNSFLDYCDDRGTLWKTPVWGSHTWNVVTDYRSSKKAYMADECFQYADGDYRYTEDELEAQWVIVRTLRGALQDCWELYRNEQI